MPVTIVKKIKQRLFLIIPFICVTFLFACSQAEQKNSPVEVKKNQQVTKVENVALQKNKEERQKKLKLQENKTSSDFRKRTFSINGDKHESNDGVLTKNSILLNLSMYEAGRVKGSFIVVTIAGKKLNLESVEVKYSSKIAQDTFRLVPVQGDDLMAVYKMLLADKSLVLVELEIDYSPIDKAMAYE